jgi:hypothetical protein
MLEATPISPPALDEALFAQYEDEQMWQEDLGFDIFEADQAHINQQKELFYLGRERGEVAIPDLRPQIASEDRSKLGEIKAKLTSFKHSLKFALHNDPEVRQAWRWRINEDIANVNMVEAACDGKPESFRAYNAFIYGNPDREIFGGVSDWYAGDAEQTIHDERPEIVEAAITVLRALGNSRGDKNILIPDKRVFEVAQDRSWSEGGFLGTLFNDVDIPPVEFIDRENGDPLMLKQLGNLSCREEIIDDSSWSMGKDGVHRPCDFRLRRQEFREYTGHEFRHAIERARGLLSRVKLSASGFDRYSHGNEGAGIAAEQMTNETFEAFTKERRWQEIMVRHLAVSLCCGLTGENMNFAETYDIVRSALLVYESQREDASETSLEDMQNNADGMAWDTVSLVYLGTNGSGLGGGWRRPMIYLEGNVRQWRAEAARPGTIERGVQGKFDLANERHVAVIRAAKMMMPDGPTLN